MILPALSLFAVQAMAATPPAEQDRLTVCLEAARRDPASAIASASEWLGEALGVEQALPRHCLGQAYVSLLRWSAAEEAFTLARDALVDTAERARFGAMAGNAALQDGRAAEALALFDTARADALAAADATLAGSIAADKARALVALDRTAEAADALAAARAGAPQFLDSWLLSATLFRREGDLVQASAMIATAAALAPSDPQVALEAGVIAILAGEEGKARSHWQSVQALAPASPEATVAGDYLAQLEAAQ